MSDNTLLINDSLLQGPRDHQKFGSSMLTSYVMDFCHECSDSCTDSSGYLQPVDLGDKSHLILGLNHHQPSPQTPFVSYVYFDKN